MRGKTIDLIIRCHHTRDLPFLNGLFERRQKCIAKQPFGNIHRCAVGTRFRLSMSGKMFQCRKDLLFIAVCCITLKTFDCRQAHLRNEIRIFSICFFNPAPPRIASDINHWCQRLVGATGACIFSNSRINIFDQLRIERCSQADRLRITCCILPRKPMQTFFMKDNRNSKTGFFYKKLLNLICKFCHFNRTQTAVRIAETGYLSYSVVQMLSQYVDIQIPFFVKENIFLFGPYT